MHEICCKNKQLHAIQSEKLAGVFSTIANTRENLKEINEYSSIFSVRSPLVRFKLVI